MSSDPELVRAIVLAALVRAPELTKRQLVSNLASAVAWISFDGTT